MTFRNLCVVCKFPFDLQHTNNLMFFIVHGGNTYDKDNSGEYGDGMVDRWSRDICSPECFDKWYKKWKETKDKNCF